MVLGSGVFGEVFRALMNGLMPLHVKGLGGGSLALFVLLPSTQQEGSHQKPDADTLILHFSASNTVRNKFLFFINYPVSSISLQQCKNGLTQTISIQFQISTQLCGYLVASQNTQLLPTVQLSEIRQLFKEIKTRKLSLVNQI